MWKLLSKPIFTVQLPMWTILPRLDPEHRRLIIRGYALSTRCRLICMGIGLCHIVATPGFVEFLERHARTLKADAAELRRDLRAWRLAIEGARAAQPAPFVNPWA